MYVPKKIIHLTSTVALTGLLSASAYTYAGDPKPTKVAATFGDEAKPTPPTASKDRPAAAPLSKTVKKGLDWLVEHQLKDGGWGQGEEHLNMGRGSQALTGKSNVADTGMAVLALMRSGSSPKAGPYSANTLKGLEFMLSQIEAADTDSLYVTDVRNTRVQGKIGPYVDTFVSSLVLSEAKGAMPDAARERRLVAALNKVLAKIEANQRTDGTWNAEGWAPALSQAMAAKGLNRAKQRGVKVDEKVLARTEEHAEGQFDKATGGFGSAGSAGVPLYGAAAASGALADSADSAEMDEAFTREAAKSKDPNVRRQAEQKLERYQGVKAARDASKTAVVARLKDPAFVSGFGSNGGEEFLSYMLVSENLVAEGGKAWSDWNTEMQANLGRVQNGDGSWTGHHCITGRTFCTASALLVLLADRAPSATADRLRHG